MDRIRLIKTSGSQVFLVRLSDLSLSSMINDLLSTLLE